MWRIVTVLTFALTWASSFAQLGDALPPDSLACSNEEGFGTCMQNFTESFTRTGLMKKLQEWQSTKAVVSPPELSTSEFEELCQIYVDTDGCFKRTGIRPRCDSNIAVKMLDNVFGYMCTPTNKKILIDKLPCVQNLTKTDPRMHNCTANIMNQLGFDETKLQQDQAQGSLTTLTDLLANLCPIMNTTFACTEPIIVQNCGHEVFDLSTKLAKNALEVLNIDCANGQNPFNSNTTALGPSGAPTAHRPQSLFDNLQIFCQGNNNGLQECTLDFIGHFFSPNGGFSMRNLTGDGSENIFRATGQMNLNKLDQICPTTFPSSSVCVTKNNLLQVCPDATFVKAFHGVLTPVCDPESRKRHSASIECLKELENSQNFSDTVHACLQSRRRRPSRQAQPQVDPAPGDAPHTMNTGSPNDLCGGMRRYVRCSKRPIIDQCGQEAFDFNVEISQNTIGLFDPTCNFTDHHKNLTEIGHVNETSHVISPMAGPHEILGNATFPQFKSNCPAGIACLLQFDQKANISAMQLDPGSLVQKISREQFIELCQQADQLLICFDANEIFTKCENDSIFATVNTAIFAMCEEPHRQVLSDHIECVTDLENRDPTIRQCISKLRNATNGNGNGNSTVGGTPERYLESLCTSVNEAYECARQPVINKCGIEVYNTMVNISATLLEPLSPGCVFASQTPIHEPVGPPSIQIPGSPAASACTNAASVCMEPFNEAQRNISINAQPSSFALVPNITQDQFVATCHQADTLRECFDEGNVWIQCEGDSRLKYLNRSLFMMCGDHFRHLLSEKLECVVRLENKDPTVRRCIANFSDFAQKQEQPGQNISLSDYLDARCKAFNGVYECAKGSVINQCGADVYAGILNISEPSLDSIAPGCKFSAEALTVQEEKTTLNPEIKKPSPGVGELVSEATTQSPKEQNSAAVGVVGSFFMLIITAMLLF